jgi:hypothetical protein
MRTHWVVLMIAITAALLAIGCGGGDGEDTDTAGVAPSTSGETEVATDAQTSEPKGGLAVTMPAAFMASIGAISADGKVSLPAGESIELVLEPLGPGGSDWFEEHGLALPDDAEPYRIDWEASAERGTPVTMPAGLSDENFQKIMESMAEWMPVYLTGESLEDLRALYAAAEGWEIEEMPEMRPSDPGYIEGLKGFVLAPAGGSSMMSQAGVIAHPDAEFRMIIGVDAESILEATMDLMDSIDYEGVFQAMTDSEPWFEEPQDIKAPTIEYERHGMSVKLVPVKMIGQDLLDRLELKLPENARTYRKDMALPGRPTGADGMMDDLSSAVTDYQRVVVAPMGLDEFKTWATENLDGWRVMGPMEIQGVSTLVLSSKAQAMAQITAEEIPGERTAITLTDQASIMGSMMSGEGMEEMFEQAKEQFSSGEAKEAMRESMRQAFESMEKGDAPTGDFMAIEPGQSGDEDSADLGASVE